MIKKWMFIIICMGLVLSGCGNVQKDDSEKQDVIIIEDNDVISDEMVEKGLQNFAEKALHAVQENNDAEFRALFVDVEQQKEQINEMYQYFVSVVSSGYTDWDYIYVMSCEDVYFCQMIASGCAGTYPSTHLQYKSYGMLLSYIDEEWKVVPNENTEWIIEVFPEEAQNAYENGRDFVMFNNYSWIDEDCVYDGALDASLYAAWKNEDGSISFLVNCKNGTDAVRSITQVSLSLYSETLQQEIVSVQAGGTDMIAPGKSVNYTITAEPEEVKLQDWGEQVSYKINHRNR